MNLPQSTAYGAIIVVFVVLYFASLPFVVKVVAGRRSESNRVYQTVCQPAFYLYYHFAPYKRYTDYTFAQIR